MIENREGVALYRPQIQNEMIKSTILLASTFLTVRLYSSLDIYIQGIYLGRGLQMSVKERNREDGPLSLDELEKLEDPNEIMEEGVAFFIDQGRSGRVVSVAALTFKCKQCGKCCKDIDEIGITEREITRLSKHLKISRTEFKMKYTRKTRLRGAKHPYNMSLLTPCPFTMEGKCDIYPMRPKSCVKFPCFTSPDIASKPGHIIVDPFCEEYNSTIKRIDPDGETNHELLTNFMKGYLNQI